MFKFLLIAFLLINAVFWGLFPHTIHCKASSLVRLPCPKHMYHQIAGAVMAALAVALFFLG